MSEESQSAPNDFVAALVADELLPRLNRQGLDLDWVAVPQGSDRMIRFRTIQEVLVDFESENDEDEARTYILQVRKQRAAAAENVALPADGIYLPNGKLNVEFLVTNARLLFQAGEYTEARKIYGALTKSGERTAEGLLGVARCLEAEGRLEEALRTYDDSILYAPSIESYRRYASLLIRTQKDQQAAEILERALLLKDLTPKHRYDLHQATGNAWLRARVVGKAERHYRKALELNSLSDAVAANLGMLCLQEKRIDEAKLAFTEALRVSSWAPIMGPCLV